MGLCKYQLSQLALAKWGFLETGIFLFKNMDKSMFTISFSLHGKEFLGIRNILELHSYSSQDSNTRNYTLQKRRDISPQLQQKRVMVFLKMKIRLVVIVLLTSLKPFMILSCRGFVFVLVLLPNWHVLPQGLDDQLLEERKGKVKFLCKPFSVHGEVGVQSALAG